MAKRIEEKASVKYTWSLVGVCVVSLIMYDVVAKALSLPVFLGPTIISVLVVCLALIRKYEVDNTARLSALEMTTETQSRG